MTIMFGFKISKYYSSSFSASFNTAMYLLASLNCKRPIIFAINLTKISICKDFLGVYFISHNWFQMPFLNILRVFAKIFNNKPASKFSDPRLLYLHCFLASKRTLIRYIIAIKLILGTFAYYYSCICFFVKV